MREMDKFFSLLFLSAACLLSLCTESLATCYFPQEFQGEYIMQTTANIENGIQYNAINITVSAIPIWGTCHRRIGNSYILTNKVQNNSLSPAEPSLILSEIIASVGMGNKQLDIKLQFRHFSFQDTSCIRCLHLKLRSSNVLQVFAPSREIFSKCFTNEESAEANCPSQESIDARETEEMLLFKIKDALGSSTTKEYCPIDGNFHVNYKGNSLQGMHECRGFDSRMDSCPSGSTLTFRFRGCSLSGNDLTYNCLAHWDGHDNQRYLIFADEHGSRSGRPKYRCALYQVDWKSGKIEMALSRDSTCMNELYNASSGFETLVLLPAQENPWPEDVQLSASLCNFPKWMMGNWEHVRVDKQTITYKDHSSFKTYTIKCVSEAAEDKYLIFSRTQCDEESYNCIKIAERSNNILEFQLGTNSSKKLDMFSLCSDENFQDDNWITQGRTEIIGTVTKGMCPITGEYTGVIPDATDLCTKLWSDCNSPELMYYQVFHCEKHEIYEEREYRCLGHWSESKLLYTYTQRKDVADGTYECFVGSMISQNEIFIKEAGEHCQRHIDPLTYGMKLVNSGLFSCTTSETTHRQKPTARTTYRPPNPKFFTSTSIPTTKSTIKQWNFDSNIPEVSVNQNSGSFQKPAYLMYLFVYIIINYLCKLL